MLAPPPVVAERSRRAVPAPRLQGAASIGDFVWQDFNENGIQDGEEPGLPAVTVRLHDSAGDGFYSFSAVAAGDYFIEFVPPGGFRFSPQDEGDDAIDSDPDQATGQTIVFSVGAGASAQTWDAGLYREPRRPTPTYYYTPTPTSTATPTLPQPIEVTTPPLEDEPTPTPTPTHPPAEEIPKESTTHTRGDSRETSIATGDPISAATGEYYFDMALFDLGGPLPLDFGLYYGSQANSKRWADGIPSRFFGNQRFTLTQAKVLDPDAIFIEYGLAQEIGFHPTADGWEAYDLEGIRYQLRQTRDYFYFLDPLQERVYVFGVSYEDDTILIAHLFYVLDRNGNTLTYEYPRTGSDIFIRGPDRVSDGLGRELLFSYEVMTTDPDLNFPFLTAVSDQAGRTWSFSYDVSPQDNLDAFTYTDDGVTLRAISDPLGDTTTFQYANQDLIVAVNRPAGNTPYTQAYNPAYYHYGSVSTQTDAYGNETRLTPDDFETYTAINENNGNPVGVRVTTAESQFTIAYPDGATRTFQHDRELRVVSALTDPAGNTIDFESDATHDRITAVTDRLGDTTRYTYHPETGKIASITDARAGVLRFTFTPQQQTFTNPDNGEQITFTFHDLTRVDYPDSSAEELTRDARGNVSTWIGRMGEAWQFTYDARGQVLALADPASAARTFIYNDDGTLASSTETGLGITTYEYDEAKNLVRYNFPDATTLQIDYDLLGRVTAVTDQLGHTYSYRYDANGNPVVVITPLGQVADYSYDLLDRLTQITDLRGQTSTATYDAVGRLTVFSDPNGNEIGFDYDPRGWLTSMTDGGGNVWRTSYDDEGVLSGLTAPLGQTTSFQSDELGNITQIVDGLGNTSTVAYDSASRPTAITDALGHTVAFAYDAWGLPRSLSWPVLGDASFQWSALGNLTQVTDLNGQDWRFDYAGGNRISDITDPLGNAWNYIHDEQGRIIEVVHPTGEVELRSFDAVDNLTRQTISDGTDLRYSYDSLSRLTETNGLRLRYDDESAIVNSEVNEVDFGATYDAGGRIETVSYADGAFEVTYMYDARDLLIRVQDSLTATQLSFIYDDNGQLVDVQRSNGVDTALSWDAACQLTRIQDGAIADQQYTLNAVGALTEVLLDVPLQPADALTARSDAFTHDEASQISSPGYAYDGRGRQISAPAQTYTWDGADRLKGSGAATLTYNGLGDLTARTGNDEATTNYYYNYALVLQPIVAEQNGSSGAFERFYIWTPDGSLLYAIDAAQKNAVNFYHFDRSGSTLFLTDAAGAVVDEYSYSPYGLQLAHNGDAAQPFTWAGQLGVRQENDSGLYHMRARYYDAVSGHFLSRDPLWPNVVSPLELNPYAYAARDPINNLDPTGTILDPLRWLAIAFDVTWAYFSRAEDAALRVGIGPEPAGNSVSNRAADGKPPDTPGSASDENAARLRHDRLAQYKTLNSIRSVLHWLNKPLNIAKGSFLNRLFKITHLAYGTHFKISTRLLNVSKTTTALRAITVFRVAGKVAPWAVIAEGALSWKQVYDHSQLTPAQISSLVGRNNSSNNPITIVGVKIGRWIGDWWYD